MKRASSRIIEHILVITIFCVLAFAHFRNAFLSGRTTAWPGDGMGGIAWMYDLHESLKAKGFSILAGDFYYTENIGGGFNVPGIPLNFFWKAYYSVLGYVFSPQNVYDFTGLLGFIFIGWAGYVLARAFSVSRWLALFCGLLLCSLDHFGERLPGHLTLATYFMPIFLLGILYRTGENPSYKNVVFLSVITWLNFVINEYYGYFGVFALLAGGSSLILWNHKAYKISSKSLVARGAVFALILLSLMAASYPHLILFKFIHSPGAELIANKFEHSSGDFDFYVMRMPWVLLKSNVPWIRSVIPSAINKLTPPIEEYTFRLGFVVPVIGTIGSVVILTARVFTQRVNTIFRQIVFLWIIGFVLYLFSLKTIYGLSLVPLTMKIAPMFRCGIRAVLFTDICLVTIFIIVLQKLFDGWSFIIESNKKRSIRLTSYGAVLVVLLIVAYVSFRDVSDTKEGQRSFEQFKTTEILPREIYLELAKYPGGYLLELPFFYPPKNRPEDDYGYLLGRIFHNKPLFNGIFFASNVVPLERLGEFFRINDLTPEKIAILHQGGIKYIIAHKWGEYDFKKLGKIKELTVLSDLKDATLYEIKGAGPYDRKYLLKNLIRPDVFTFDLDTLKNYPSFAGIGKAVITPDLPLEAMAYRAIIKLEKNGNPVAFGEKNDLALEARILSGDKVIAVATVNEGIFGKDSFAVVTRDIYLQGNENHEISVAVEVNVALGIRITEIKVERNNESNQL